MSNTDTFENEGGSAGQERMNYSPAAGLGNDTADADVTPSEDTSEDDDSDDEDGVELTAAPSNRGVFVDAETGTRFRKGRTSTVSESDAERLLSLRRHGQPVVVRADS